MSIPVATITASDEELAAHGIRFESLTPSGDEPGPVEVGVVRTRHGSVDLVRHVGHPELGIEIRADRDAHPNDVVQAVMTTLDLPASRTIWVRSSSVVRAAEDTPPYGAA